MYDNGSIYKTDDSGVNWTDQNNNSIGAAKISFVNETTGYCITVSGKIKKTTDSGVNWTHQNVNNIFTDDSHPISFVK